MSDLEKLIAMFPIVFMIHDFEEIMGFESWLKNNREELKQRFPKVENFLSKKGMFQVSTSKFAFAVCIIFILVSLVSFISLYSGVYQWWFVAFSAFFCRCRIVYIRCKLFLNEVFFLLEKCCFGHF